MRLPLAFLVLTVVGLGTFLAVRQFAPDLSVRADPQDEAPTPIPNVTPPVGPQEEYTPEGIPTGAVGEEFPPGDDVTPEPGATPDTSQSWWYIPYLNAERDKPIAAELTINGITVGSEVDSVMQHCPTEGARVAFEGVSDPSERVSDPALRVNVDVLPSSAQLGHHGGGANHMYLCEDSPLAVLSDFSFRLDQTTDSAGGWAWVAMGRWHGLPQVRLHFPEERWSATEIAGFPAAMAEPILPDIGLGPSAIVVYADGVVTLIQAHGLPLDRVIAIAEGQFQ